MGVRTALLVVMAGLLGLSLAPFPSAPGAAGCAAPMLVVAGQEHGRTPALVRGAEVTVRGRAFIDGCDDVGEGSVSPGCDDDPGAVEDPMENVELRLRATAVGSADADADGTITWTFTVPADLEVGPAALTTLTSERLRVRVE